MRIEDPAIRSIMQSIIVERDKLKAPINVLKSHTHVTVDRRPLGADISTAPGAQPVTILAMAAQLTPRSAMLCKKQFRPTIWKSEVCVKEAMVKSKTKRGVLSSKSGSAALSAKFLGSEFKQKSLFCEQQQRKLSYLDSPLSAEAV
jgi:hypothetical protein